MGERTSYGCACRNPVWALLVVLSVFCLPVWAEDAREPVPPAPKAWAEGHRWARVGLDQDVSRLEVTPSGVVLALTQTGAVWRWGAETSWRLVLGAPGARLDDPDAVDEEALLLDAESVLGEQNDFAESRRTGRSTEDEDEGDDKPAEQSSQDGPVESEELSEVLIQSANKAAHERSGAQALWASGAVSGLVLCARADGAWRSDDDGLTWERSTGLPSVYAFTQAPGGAGLILAGTGRGLRESADQGRTWVQADSVLRSTRVYSFAADAARLWAGTEEGLYVFSKAVGWAKMVPRRDSDMPVWALAVDPYWKDGLWLAGPVGILRTDDGGESMRPSGRNPLAGTRSLVPLDAGSHVLAAGTDGVWESQDGGIRWRPLARGLPLPMVAAVLVTPRGILAAGAAGVFVLRRAKLAEVAQLNLATDELKTEPLMGELVEVALRRPGLRIDNVLTHQNLVLSMMLPKLSVNGRADRYRYITADHIAQTNKGGVHWGWFAGATACFGNCSSSVSFSDVDISTLADDYGVDIQSLPELAVVGDEVYVADSAGSLAPVAANVAERMTRYRSEVSNRVSELSLARRRLVEARADVRSLSLRDQAAHELRILESAARIDVYTNGYFTRVLNGR